MTGLVARVVGNSTMELSPSACDIKAAISDTPKCTLKGRHPVRDKTSRAGYRQLPSLVRASPKISLDLVTMSEKRKRHQTVLIFHLHSDQIGKNWH
jgi:hypothetical protein